MKPLLKLTLNHCLKNHINDKHGSDHRYGLKKNDYIDTYVNISIISQSFLSHLQMTTSFIDSDECYLIIVCIYAQRSTLPISNLKVEKQINVKNIKIKSDSIFAVLRLRSRNSIDRVGREFQCQFRLSAYLLLVGSGTVTVYSERGPRNG